MSALLIDRLRRDLVRAEFSVEPLEQLWGGGAANALQRGNRVPALRALAHNETSALSTLARLFIVGVGVSIADAEAAFSETGVAGAAALGLIAVDDDSVTALSDLRPYAFVDSVGEAEWWIASDRGEMVTGVPISEDHVLGVGGASLTLSRFAVQTPVEAVFDLGTGCGIQAMHASRHAERVVASDISERALHYARFNAALNGIDSIEFRLGSLFEPVQGDVFDRIVSNPPFVITPRQPGVPNYEYRDGGMVGDELVATVIRGGVGHLKPGGMVQLLGNWESRAGARGLDRAAAWTAGLGVDAWIVEREFQDVAQYTETWIRDGGIRQGTVEFETLSAAWLDDFSARGVTGVGFGFVTLRLPDGERPTLARFETCTGAADQGALAAHIAAVIDAHDRLVVLDDRDLLACRLSVASDVTEERHYWPGAADPTVLLLRQGGAFARIVSADTVLAGFVGACDGELSVGAISAALAQLLDTDEADVTASLLRGARELLMTGFLTFA